MADIGDCASKIDELAWSMFKTHDFEAESNKYCEECGNEIPEQRRLYGNVKHCVSCKSIMEQNSKHVR